MVLTIFTNCCLNGAYLVATMEAAVAAMRSVQ
jgi:hypothetical protein